MTRRKKLFNISRKDFDALLFDLDGVITKTARVHSMSWKQLFDEYIRDTDRIPEKDKKPFDPEYDYHTFVDGKPRYEGVKSFLESRGISLPFGKPDDSPEEETVCGLGNRKNRYFQEYLEQENVEIHHGSREFLELVKDKGFRTAVVTSSRNCSIVLKSAGLSDIFDIQVDGLTAASLNLKGKPEADTFLEAARKLHVNPERAIVFEDALAGVQAGRAGHFGYVIGVDRANQGKALEEKGADLVVKDLTVLSVEGQMPVTTMPMGNIPSAMKILKHLEEELLESDPFIALDYDGTLTPIVERPELAVLSPEMRSTLKKLAERFPVAIISGRDLKDIKEFIRLDNLIYAGSHGFDISSPPRINLAFQMGREFIPILDRIQRFLEQQVRNIDGVILERKKFSLAVHYRMVAEDQVNEVELLVDMALIKEPKLKKGLGKKVFELKPDLDWDKGQALLWLIEGMGMDMDKTLPLYIGDDITDEDAFRTLQNTGMGIVVREGERERRSMAEYSLENTMEVRIFLEELAGIPSKGEKP